MAETCLFPVCSFSPNIVPTVDREYFPYPLDDDGGSIMLGRINNDDSSLSSSSVSLLVSVYDIVYVTIKDLLKKYIAY